MMDGLRNKNESGQVLVILVVALVALLGFGALALDGGMLFSDRRYDQNVADDSALAGVGAAGTYMDANRITFDNFSCGTGHANSAMQVALNAAVQSAASNNFVLAKNLDTKHGVVATCGVDDLGGYKDKYIDVRVMVTSNVKTSFAHLLFGGELKNTVEAVARVRPRTSYAFGYAIASLDDDCQGGVGGVTLDGDTWVAVIQSGVFSNSCLVKNGGIIIDADTGIFYLTTYSENGNSGSVTPDPRHVSVAIPRWEVPAPNCASVPERGEVDNGGSILPGRYSSIRVNNADLVMAPGLYCLSGNFTANGGTVSITGSSEDGVTIFITDGNFSAGGNVTINLRAPMEGSTVVPPAIQGMLIYLAEGNDGLITVQGNSESSYRGSVFAPDGSIEVGGTNSTVGNLRTQFIANTVKVHGTSNMNVEYDGDEVYTRSPYIALQK